MIHNPYFVIFANSLWSGIAELAFAILFNIPKKVITTVLFLGFLAGLIKALFIHFEFNIIIATFFAALSVGIFSIPFASRVHKPIVVFSIPSIIPMIPGFFAYKTILAIRQFTFYKIDNVQRDRMLDAIFSNGFMTLFILFAITVGVSGPMLILGKDMTRRLKD